MGVGMTERQSLTMVELPLALPVIMAGVRTAAVWVIGTATLSTPIGQTSLGNYIFTGLQTQNWVLRAVRLRRRRRAGAGGRPAAGADRARLHACGAAIAWRPAGIGLALIVLLALIPNLLRAPRRLCARRQAVRRAVHPGRADRGPAARQGARGQRAATGSARPSSSMRWPRAISTPTSSTPAPSGPTRCSAPTCCRAPRCWRRSPNG